MIFKNKTIRKKKNTNNLENIQKERKNTLIVVDLLVVKVGRTSISLSSGCMCYPPMTLSLSGHSQSDTR